MDVHYLVNFYASRYPSYLQGVFVVVVVLVLVLVFFDGVCMNFLMRKLSEGVNHYVDLNINI